MKEQFPEIGNTIVFSIDMHNEISLFLDLTESWKFMEDYCEAFQPLFICTKDMQATHVSLGDFYLKWLIAIQKVKQVHPNPFVEPLVKSMDTRLALLKKSRAFKMSLYIDPRLNYAGSSLFDADEKEKIQVIQKNF